MNDWFESVRRAVRRYLSGEDLGVVSKLVRDRSGMLEERLMMELGRSPAKSSSLEGLRLPVKEGEDEVGEEAVDAAFEAAKPDRVLL